MVLENRLDILQDTGGLQDFAALLDSSGVFQPWKPPVKKKVLNLRVLVLVLENLLRTCIAFESQVGMLSSASQRHLVGMQPVSIGWQIALLSSLATGPPCNTNCNFNSNSKEHTTQSYYSRL